MVFPRDYNLSDAEARPWRSTVARLMIPEMVMKVHLPLMVPDFMSLIRSCALSQNLDYHSQTSAHPSNTSANSA
jgi:hypothetical protein